MIESEIFSKTNNAILLSGKNRINRCCFSKSPSFKSFLPIIVLSDTLTIETFLLNLVNDILTFKESYSDDSDLANSTQHFLFLFTEYPLDIVLVEYSLKKVSSAS